APPRHPRLRSVSSAFRNEQGSARNAGADHIEWQVATTLAGYEAALAQAVRRQGVVPGRHQRPGPHPALRPAAYSERTRSSTVWSTTASSGVSLGVGVAAPLNAGPRRGQLSYLFSARHILVVRTACIRFLPRSVCTHRR